MRVGQRSNICDFRFLIFDFSLTPWFWVADLWMCSRPENSDLESKIKNLKSKIENHRSNYAKSKTATFKSTQGQTSGA